MSSEDDKQNRKRGYATLAIIGAPVLLFVVYIVIADQRDKRNAQAKYEVREALDRGYGEQLKLLDHLYDQVAARCTQEERQQVYLAQAYQHTVEESSHDGSDDYRQQTFESLQSTVKDLQALTLILHTNASISPMRAKELVPGFRCF
jgi:hypothetical protein